VEADHVRQGIIEGLSRLLRELLRTPKFRDLARLILQDLDPENAPLVVRTLAREDPELFLATLSRAPALANALIGALHELLLTLTAYPPAMAQVLGSGLADEFDARRCGEAVALGLVLEQRLAASQNDRPPSPPIAERFVAGFAETLAAQGAEAGPTVDKILRLGGQAIQRAIAAMNRDAEQSDSLTTRLVTDAADELQSLWRDNPAFVDKVIRPLAAALRGPAMSPTEKNHE